MITGAALFVPEVPVVLAPVAAAFTVIVSGLAIVHPGRPNRHDVAAGQRVSGSGPTVGSNRPRNRSRRARRSKPASTRQSSTHRLPTPPLEQVVSIGLALVILLPTVVFGPVVGLALFGAGSVALRSRARRRAELRRRRLDESAPELIDLFGVAIAAGQPVPTALATVGDRAPQPTRAAMRAAMHRLETGGTVASALIELDALGEAYTPLIEVLRAGHQRGAPVLDALDRIAETARDRRRRNAEARARRLPVTMLFPLVMCTLPAFGLLAVVPLLVASLTDLL